jgi:hypothetical protein
MTLVGPRPERPEFVAPLSEQIPDYTERLSVRPGVTGLAQIQLPADSGIESVRSKLSLDLCYIQKETIWLDLRILLGTVLYLVGFSYAKVRKFMFLPNPLAEQGVLAGSSFPHIVGPIKVMCLFKSQRNETAPSGSLSCAGDAVPSSETQ